MYQLECLANLFPMTTAFLQNRARFLILALDPSVYSGVFTFSR